MPRTRNRARHLCAHHRIVTPREVCATPLITSEFLGCHPPGPAPSEALQITKRFKSPGISPPGGGQASLALRTGKQWVRRGGARRDTKGGGRRRCPPAHQSRSERATNASSNRFAENAGEDSTWRHLGSRIVSLRRDSDHPCANMSTKVLYRSRIYPEACLRVRHGSHGTLMLRLHIHLWKGEGEDAT